MNYGILFLKSPIIIFLHIFQVVAKNIEGYIYIFSFLILFIAKFD
jgi:hypothetical protein